MRYFRNLLVTRRFNKQIGFINQVGIIACVQYFDKNRSCDHG